MPLLVDIILSYSLKYIVIINLEKNIYMMVPSASVIRVTVYHIQQQHQKLSEFSLPTAKAINDRNLDLVQYIFSGN